MIRKIPRFDDYPQIGRLRCDPALALANSHPRLIACGLVEGTNMVHKFGAATGVDTALTAITTAKVYRTPTTAVALEVVSDSVDDNGAASPLGSGALMLRIYGLQTWDEESIADVTLNGTTAVALPGTWLRIYRVKVIESGVYASYGTPSHNSTITIREAGGGDTWAQTDSLGTFGLGQSEIAVYSVPRGRVAYVHSACIFIEATRTANVIFFARENADIIIPPYAGMQAKIVLRDVANAVGVKPDTPVGAFNGPCDIGWMGAANIQAANISIDFEIELHDA